MVYEPQEDSELLSLHVQRLAYGQVLDMATGSGVLAQAAASSREVKTVLAVDVDKESIAWAKKHNPDHKISYRASDFFSNVKGSFDTIICNPPYLPGEQGLKDQALVGGKRGYEWISKFLQKAVHHLYPGGQILMVYSSLSKPHQIMECVQALLLEGEQLDKKHIFFEDILVMRFTKSSVRNRLEKEGFENLQYFARGKRGWIFTALYKGKKVAIKIKNPSSFAVSSIQHEAEMLKRLNRYDIGPKLIKATDQYVAYTFIEGAFITEFLEKASKKRILKVLKGVMDQCRTMDRLGISKEEMTRPIKHILISKGDKPILIDFERAHTTHKQHNVTQFCQFLSSVYVRFILASKGMHLDPLEGRRAAHAYQKMPTRSSFQGVVKWAGG